MKTLTFETISGQMTFDEVHNPVKGVLIARVLNGQVVYIDRVTP